MTFVCMEQTTDTYCLLPFTTTLVHVLLLDVRLQNDENKLKLYKIFMTHVFGTGQKGDSRVDR